MGLPQELLELATEKGREAAEMGLDQAVMAVVIDRFRKDMPDWVPAEWSEEFCIAAAEAYFRHRPPETIN